MKSLIFKIFANVSGALPNAAHVCVLLGVPLFLFEIYQANTIERSNRSITLVATMYENGLLETQRDLFLPLRPYGEIFEQQTLSRSVYEAFLLRLIDQHPDIVESILRVDVEFSIARACYEHGACEKSTLKTLLGPLAADIACIYGPVFTAIETLTRVPNVGASIREFAPPDSCT